MSSQIYKSSLKTTVFRGRDNFKLLANAAKILEGYLSNLKTRHLTITIDDYKELGVQLNRLKSIKGSDFEYIRQTLVSSLETLMAAVALLANYGNLLGRYEATLAQAKILDNVDTILAYLNQIKVSLFPDAVVTTQRALIKEEYALYIQRYGPPVDGVFDVTLLANIMAEI